MSLFSKIKDVGTSAAILTQLFGKTWDLLESEERVSFIFKAGKELHRIINGKSTIERYDFIPNSRTLIIYDSGKGGISNHLKFVDENTLILLNEDNLTELCFSNRNSKNPPKDNSEAYKFYFAKQIEYIQRNFERFKGAIFAEMTNDVDKVVEGLDDDDKIRLVNTLRKFLPDFNTKYLNYLGYYCKTHDPNFDEHAVYRNVGNFFVWKSPSETLDYYIRRTGDNIRDYRIDCD